MSSANPPHNHSPGVYVGGVQPADAAANNSIRRNLPVIFFVGPPRTATTWLHAVLKDRMNLPRLKETYFFDKYYFRGFQWYLSHFSDPWGCRIKAEIAPSYFFSQDARQRIRAAVSDAKIVVTLRDPVLRLYSLYKMRASNVAFRWTFEQACELDDELRTTAECAPDLAAWQQFFGRSNVLTLIYEDLKPNPQAWIEQVCRFAGIPSFDLTAGQMVPVHSSESSFIPRYPAWTGVGVSAGNWIYGHEWEWAIALVKKLRLRRFFLENGRRFPSLDVEVEEKLRRKLVTDIEGLELILGRDLGMWKPAARNQATARRRGCKEPLLPGLAPSLD